MIRHRAELKTLRDGGQQQRRFHHCERIANALPGAAAEWEVCKARQLLRSFRQPAIRIEFLRIGKISPVVTHGSCITTLAPDGMRYPAMSKSFTTVLARL